MIPARILFASVFKKKITQVEKLSTICKSETDRPRDWAAGGPTLSKLPAARNFGNVPSGIISLSDGEAGAAAAVFDSNFETISWAGFTMQFAVGGVSQIG
jgi:hypothetical protein